MNLSKPELDKNEIQGQYYLVIDKDIYLKAQIKKDPNSLNLYIKIYLSQKFFRNEKIGSINLYKFNEDLIGKPIFPPEKIKKRELNKDYLVNYQDTFCRARLSKKDSNSDSVYYIEIYDCKSRTLLKTKKLDCHLFKFTQDWEGKNLDFIKEKYTNDKKSLNYLKSLFIIDEREDCPLCFNLVSYDKHKKCKQKLSSKLISNKAVRSNMRPESLASQDNKEVESDYDNFDSNTEIQSDSDQETEEQDDKQKADEFMRECKINNCISYKDSLYSIEDHKRYNNNTIRSNARFYYYVKGKGVTPVKQDTKGAIVVRADYKYVRDTETVYFIPEGKANTEVVDITRSSQEKMVPCKKGCGKMTMNGTHRGRCKDTPVCGGANKKSKGNTNNRKRKRPTPPPSSSNVGEEEKVGYQGADSIMEYIHIDHIGLFRCFLGSKKKQQRIDIVGKIIKEVLDDTYRLMKMF